MSMLATLRRSGGIEALARHLQVPPPVAAEVASALLPLVLGAFRRSCQVAASRQDIAPLLALLDAIGSADLAVMVMGTAPIDRQLGLDVAARVFGSDAAVQTVTRVAAQVFPDDGETETMLTAALPLLTMLVGGYLAARAVGAGLKAGNPAADFADLLGLGKQPNPLDAILPPDPKQG